MIVASANGWTVSMAETPTGRLKTTIEGPEEPPLILYFAPEVVGLIAAIVRRSGEIDGEDAETT